MEVDLSLSAPCLTEVTGMFRNMVMSVLIFQLNSVDTCCS